MYSPLVLPILSILAAMVSIQYGAALAKGLFPELGPVAATLLRLWMAAVLLALIYRPWRGTSLRGRWPVLVGYGVAMGLMNLSYYLALQRLPMGIVVAIEFLGPLGVAIATSHRRLDWLWVALAIAGLLLLLPWQTTAPTLDLVGVGFALLAGAGWALYILFGSRTGSSHGGRTVALGMILGAAAVTPSVVLVDSTMLFNPALLPIALAVAVLSSALPYTLEMYALTRMPNQVFSLFMSVEPALAALMGAVVLHEQLTSLQWLAIVCVMAASFGSAMASQRRTSS